MLIRRLILGIYDNPDVISTIAFYLKPQSGFQEWFQEQETNTTEN